MLLRLRLALQFIDAISQWVAKVACWLIIVMMVITVYEVVTRYVLENPSHWPYELAGLLLGPLWLLGGAYVLLVGGHVNLDLLHRRLPRRGQAIIDLVTYSLFFLYCTLILLGGWDYFWLAFTRHAHSRTIWGPPLAPFWLMIPIGAGLILLAGIAKYIRNLYIAITGRLLE